MNDKQRKAMFAKILKNKLISNHAVLSKNDFHHLTGETTTQQPYLFLDSDKLQYAFSKNKNDDQWELQDKFTRLNNNQSEYVLKHAKFRENNW